MTDPWRWLERLGGLCARRRAACVLLLILFHALIGATWVVSKSTTFDETLHLAGGISYWATGDYRLQPENGNLAQRAIALPAYLLGDYQTDVSRWGPAWQQADIYIAHETILFEDNPGLLRAVYLGRLVVVAFSCLLAWWVYFFASRLYGPAGGLLALLLYCCCPILIANASLMTSDLFAALFFTWTVGWCALCMDRATPARLAMLGAGAAGLALSKHSMPLVLPACVACAAVMILRKRPWRVTAGALGAWRLRGRAARAAGAALVVLGVTLCTFGAVWAAYGFRHGVQPAGAPETFVDYPIPRAVVFPEESAPMVTRVIEGMNRMRLLPDPYLYGAGYVIFRSGARESFFMGAHYNKGTAWYFPVGFLIKTPVPMLALLALGTCIGLGAWVRARRAGAARLGAARVLRVLPWWVLLAAYGGAALLSTLNLGVRHLLPMLPAMFILGGCIGRWMVGARLAQGAPRWAAGGVGVLCVLLVAETLWTWPNYLAYFNQAAGGPSKGYRWMVDSNLDWGQDLPGLRDWAARHGLDDPARYGDETQWGTPRRLYVSVFGSTPIWAYGVPGEPIYCYVAQRPTAAGPVTYRGGTYAISATMLQQVSSIARYGWDEEREAYFQEALLVLEHARQGRLPPQDAAHLIDRAEQVRFGRFCAFLRQREPDAQIGYAINIYHVTDAQVDAYLHGPPPPSHGRVFRE